MAKEVTTAVQFEVDEAGLVLSDPCYIDHDDVSPEGGMETPGILSWGDGMHLFTNARQGWWTAEIQVNDEGAWGNRVAKLIAMCDGYNPVERRGADGVAAVDSGQMFVGAASTMPIDYDRLLASYNGPDGEWVNRNMLVCQEGAVSSTGFGDGAYGVEVGYDREGQVVEVAVTFIGDEENECSECGYNEDDCHCCPDCYAAECVCDEEDESDD
jgi:hypothetical protein